MPHQIDEDIIVFCKGKVNYYPQMRKGPKRKRGGYKAANRVMGRLNAGYEAYSDEYYPVNIIELANPRMGKLHPTEKPVALLEIIIRHYSKPGDLVLDNCIGSGSTAIACLNTGRNFIGIEKDREHFRTAKARLKDYFTTKKSTKM